MSVDGGTIELKFLIDKSQLEAAMSGATASITKLKVAAGETAPAVTKMGSSIDDAGSRATTNAVKFQTLAQGALNLTTSFAQAYTSISNLSRAQTSLQSAAVGVERAQDSLARTTYNLNKARNSSTHDIEKINILMDRQTTQTDALQVAQRHLKDEQDRINDTYVLFAVNLVNVGFSAIQTIKVMRDLTKGMSALDLITNKYVLIALIVIAAWEGMAQAIKLVNKELGSQLSIIDNVTKLMDKFGHTSDITLKGYNSKLDEAGDSWERLTGTIQKETEKQTAIVRYWQNKQIEMMISTNDRVASNFLKLNNSGSQQANPTKAPVKGAVNPFGGYFVAGATALLASGGPANFLTNDPFSALDYFFKKKQETKGPISGPGEFNPITRRFNPLVGDSTRIRQDQFGNVVTSIIPFQSTLRTSIERGGGIFEVPNAPTMMDRYVTELARTDYDLSQIDDKIFDAQKNVVEGNYLDPTANAILAGLRVRKDILLTSKNIISEDIFNEQNRKTDSDFEFTPNTNFGASITENNLERALNLRAQADLAFVNSELYRESDPNKSQKYNTEGLAFAKQAARASQIATSETFKYGTNTGRANQIADVSRILTTLQYSNPKSKSALDYAVSQLGRFGLSFAGKNNSTKLGSNKKSAIGGQADTALKGLAQTGGPTSPAYKGFADAMKGLSGGLPSFFANDPSRLVLGRGAYTASALGLVGGSKGSQATAMQFKGRLTQGAGKSSRHGNVFGSVLFAHNQQTAQQYGDSALGQTAQYLTRYLGDLGIRANNRGPARGGGVNFANGAGNFNFLAGEISSLFPLITDIPQTAQTSFSPFESALSILRQFREQVQGVVGLSFANQHEIEVDQMRARNELENRVRFMQRLESASGGMTGF